MEDRNLNLFVTLWPSFSHFHRFASDSRIAGIRLNSAMVSNPELVSEFKLLSKRPVDAPLYLDVKGRQLRVAEVLPNTDHLDIRLNHPISVVTPIVVLFKAASDRALLVRLEEEGRRLIFDGGPEYMVEVGESLHIRHGSLSVKGPQFTDTELAKIAAARNAGFARYFLSYVESARDVDEFRELVGKDAQVMLKIENRNGMRYVAQYFRKRPELTLVAARGDLYVELDRPHEILAALRKIIKKDPEAMVGSRLLLSVFHEQVIEVFRSVVKRRPKEIDYDRLLARMKEPGVPNCADWHELAWLYDIGYRNMLLCDEICLEEKLLGAAINAFQSFRQTYAKERERHWLFR